MYHILVVDDDKINLAIAKQELSDEYHVTPVISGAQALQFLEKKTPNLILLDLMMPDMDGKETMRRIKEREEWANIPILFLTADDSPETESECLLMGAADFVIKPFVPTVMKTRIRRIIELDNLKNNLEIRLEEKTAELERVTLNAIMAIASAIEAKDEYTRGHSARVAECSEALARRLGWSDEECQNLRYIALLHDIGKIGVPDWVLNKPTRLTDEEFAIIKKHPVTGGEILKGLKMLPHVEEGALYHHERYDGRGYPYGLKGEDIPLCARIIGIADSFDAMTSNRIYRGKQPSEYVISEFERCAGTQFDPELAMIFVQMLREGFTLTYDDGSHGKALTIKQNEGGKDILTGIYTADTAKLRINEHLAQGHKGALLIISPDNLGQVNEVLGQLEGDNLMKACAKSIKAAAGEQDIPCRMDGDELALFLPGVTDKDAAVQKAEAILNDIARYTSKITALHVVVSAGVSFTGYNLDDYIKHAEQALYLAVMTEDDNAVEVFEKPESKVEVQHVLTGLNRLCRLIDEERDNPSEMYSFGYEEFRRLYPYINNHIIGNRRRAEIMMFTLKDYEGDVPNTTALEQSMTALANAISEFLRLNDIAARYSSCQCVAILPEGDGGSAESIAQRIAERFYKICPSRNTELSYDIRSLNYLFEN